MKLHFTGDIAEIEAGLAVVGPLLGVERAAGPACRSRSSAWTTTGSR